jgi:recombination protein RecR
VSASYAPPVQRLVTELSKLPGVGNRTAQRLAFHILRASAEDAAALAGAIQEVKEKIGLCEVCFNLTDEARCRICQDAGRDQGLICVVEEPSDVIPMERTHEYHGLYHVLGGALSPIEGIDPEDLKIAELFARVASPDGPAPGAGGPPAALEAPAPAADGSPAAEAPPPAAGGPPLGGAGGVVGDGQGKGDGRQAGPGWGGAVREVVLATNPTTTGEATALHIAEELRARAPGLTVTRLASGLPVGSDLEYADEVTLGKAFAGRRAVYGQGPVKGDRQGPSAWGDAVPDLSRG